MEMLAGVNATELPRRLVLGGYIAVASAGLALPCYGVSRLPNQWYTAACDPSGDPQGRIIAFAESGLGDVVVLDDHLLREVGIGDRWVDVFVWDGVPHVGTREELWSALADLRTDIHARAPLSAVDLAFGADVKARRRAVRAGAAFLSGAYGDEQARSWRRQVARTRFLARLAEAGLPFRPDTIIVTGAGEGTTLAVDSPGWAVLDDDAKDLLHRAAAATAEELGLRLRTPRSLRPAIPPFRREWAPRSGGLPPELFPDVLPPGDPRRDAPDLSILIITAGSRAEKIARAVKAPDWAPEWLETGPFRPDRVLRGQAHGESWMPWIEVRRTTEKPGADRYGAVVVLADDRVVESSLPDLIDKARRAGGGETVVLLAPALPEAHASHALNPLIDSMGPEPDLIIDTSLARSPIWGTAERLALERRICDLIVTTAQACLLGSGIRRSVLARRGDPRTPRLASLGLWNVDDVSVDRSPDELLVSESNGDPAADAWLDEVIPLVAHRKRAPAVRLTVASAGPNFGRYATLVLEHSERRERVSTPSPWIVPIAAPRALSGHLDRPDLAIGLELKGRRGPCLLTAETPTLEILRDARSMGWNVLRVTDASGLRRLTAEDAARVPVPTEIALPKLRRFQSNRRLATRGVDTRDVVRVPAATGLHSSIRDDHQLREHARTYLPPSGEIVGEPDLIVPVRLLQQLSESPLAQDLLRFRTRGATGRRLADLAVLWEVPEFHRYILEDGRLPPRIMGIQGGTLVPAQSYFAIDGDEGVPMLFGSIVFAVWARLTRSRGNGWAQRFAVSRTFETFPILPPFTMQASPTGGLELVTDKEHPVGALAAGLRPPPSFAQWEVSAGVRERDAAVLELYGLPPAADELEIVERLLELNRFHDDIDDDVFDIRNPLPL